MRARLCAARRSRAVTSAPAADRAPPPTQPRPPARAPRPAAAPKRVADQLATIFGPAIGAASDLLVVPTCQRAECDLVNTGEKVDEEKDRLLENVRPPAPHSRPSRPWAAALHARRPGRVPVGPLFASAHPSRRARR